MNQHKYLLGIDLGTSSVKSVIMDVHGQIAAIAQHEYAINTPRPNWAEQDPEIWWGTTCRTIRKAISMHRLPAAAIAGIGFSGQMHGTVLLDAQRRLLHPAIIWADQRSMRQANIIMEKVGWQRMGAIACNRVAPGFMAATLLWLREYEPDIFSKIQTVLSPKDYVRFRLTGEIGTDFSDASATLLFDVGRWQWSKPLQEELELSDKIFPSMHEAYEIVGKVNSDAARQTGLEVGTPVVAGGGDQPVAAFGNGIIHDGIVLLTIGTGGQLFTPLRSILFDQKLRTHTFCHCILKKWFLMGAMLSAGLSLKWFREHFDSGNQANDYATLSAAAASVMPGAEGLFFLPYLLGERTPYMDADARGGFIGLSFRHNRNHLLRAILEGVIYGMRDSFEIFKDLGVKPSYVVVSGGGANSPVWLQIIADILGCQVMRTLVREQAAVGAAMLAGLGCGIYKNAEEACRQIITYSSPIEPNPRNVEFYQDAYQIYRELYPTLKNRFKELGRLRTLYPPDFR